MDRAETQDGKAQAFTAPSLIQALAERLGPAASRADLAAFVEQVARDCDPPELAGLSTADLAAMLADFWTFAASHPDLAMRVRSALGAEGRDLGRDLLEIVQPDRPFLVDSIMGEVADFGLPVKAMFHPVVDAPGKPLESSGPKRVSMIQVHLDPLGDDRRTALMDRLKLVLDDVSLAVGDFAAMQALMRNAVAELTAAPMTESVEARAEALAFLAWLAADHFVFLGARVYAYPRTEDGGYAAEEPLYQPGDSLGVLRDPSRAVLRRSNEPAVLSNQVLRALATAAPLTVAKANLRSLVHRRAYMDYIGVRRYGADGRPSGEIRFVGLFTAEAYDIPADDTPLIRLKVRNALERSGVGASAHNRKRLQHILEDWPRDELFQMSEDDLLTMGLAVLHLTDRPRVRLLVRRDPFDRFISALLYVPRERYDSELRIKAGQMLAEAFNGRVSAYYPTFSDAPMARVHFIIGVDSSLQLFPDITELETAIAEAARTWEDRFEAAMRGRGGSQQDVAATLARYAGAFSSGYRAYYDAKEALADVAAIGAMAADDRFRVRAYRDKRDSDRQFHFKFYLRGGSAPLADVLPILEHMGLKALIEDAFEINPADGGGVIWVHEFLVEDERGDQLTFEGVCEPFESTFAAVWRGSSESDRFNRLVIELGISWREAALIRALARYRQQSGLDPSQAVQEQALSDHPNIARMILDVFKIKFDPSLAMDVKARTAEAAAVMNTIILALQGVESLDSDRVLRRIALLVQALKRTNYYQTGADGEPKPYISFKIASRDLEDLPAPKPFREIFVWAPHVEGVHLRFGPVARGGLRWSDRRDDFRTEVLGLVKAQQVKNAVIVPVGSKGGFFPKQLPRGGSADVVRTEAIRAYKTFLSGLLDLTDNIDAAGAVIPPADLIIHEGDDPYLVVAADKGTATFSDIANSVAEAYGFWLGDAFASGGSAGYDHKVMGITARGAWEAVKRHFRELGKDIQTQPFTVAGVGDMSGDVFGNGMLLSKATRLVAAFDHRHIFLDPDPDPALSWEERSRLFALPRSSWDDYDRTKLSTGGGVFPRSLKSIPLTAQVKALLDLKVDAIAPADLVTAILKARVELLYLGGIGTYVKARAESHADAGDKASDAVRINGADLRCKVVGEGANLGLTQAGRIEFALAGGRINTDAIDNSAGVDSSDHEVNIKILTGMIERAGALSRPDRNTLLASMTDAVAANVLVHNYDQTLALSLLEADSVRELGASSRFMSELEAAGRLNRKVEGLPDAAALAERAQAGKGLTRPELAVLLAYSKLELSEEIVASNAPDDPVFEGVLEAYFPAPLKTYRAEMRRHRLRREIIATVLDNDIVNICGPTFPHRLRAAASCDTAALVIGFEAARRVLDFNRIWTEVEGLDGNVPAQGQLALFKALANALRAQTFWFARRVGKDGESVQSLVRAYQSSFATLRDLMPGILSSFEQKTVARRAKAFTQDGAPPALAGRIALLQPLTTAADLVDMASASSWPVENVARLYHQLGAAFELDQLRAAAGGLRAGDPYERLAVRRLIEDLLSEQAALTRAVVTFAANKQAGETADAARAAVSSWSALRAGPAREVVRTIDEIEKAGGGWSFAKLTIANASVRALVAAV